MSKVGGWLKTGVQFKRPAIGDRIIQKSFQGIRRRIIYFDFISLPVKVDATVIVRGYMDKECEHGLVEIRVKLLGDVRTEIGVGAIGSFLRDAAEAVVEKSVGVGLSIGRNNGLRQERRRIQGQDKKENSYVGTETREGHV